MKIRSATTQKTLSEKFREIDRVVPILAVLLAVYGAFAVASAQQYLGTPRYLIIQIVADVLGAALMLMLSVIDLEAAMKRLAVPFFAVSVVLLLLTLVFGHGEGNRAWIDLPILPVNVQPSELVKVLFILSFGYHLGRCRAEINKPKTFFFLLLHGGVIMGLVALQGDLGSALVFAFAFLVMLFSAGLSLFYFLGMGAVVVAASPFLWEMLSDYQKKRILVGFNPESDPLDKGYQVICSKNAIAGGGLFGTGYMNGLISQNPAKSALPARHTDFIFSVIAEELGFFGVLILVLLLFALIFRILHIARGASDRYGSYFCVGAVAILLFQSLENIGMCIGLLPVIGLTLPFISYGGSSVLSVFLLMGVVLSVSRKEPDTQRLTGERHKLHRRRKGHGAR